MYSNHELINLRSNDTIQSQRALAQAKHDPQPAPSLHSLLYGSEAPDNLKQSPHVLARALCGDLYHLDALLQQCTPFELLNSLGSDNKIWLDHLVAEVEGVAKEEEEEEVKKSEQSLLNQLLSEQSTTLNLALEGYVKSAYTRVKSKIDAETTSALCAKALFTRAILGRMAFELSSECMAEGAFLYGFWLTTLPYHANTELDVTLEPRQSRQAFNTVLGKNATPAFLFHSFYYSDAGNTTFAALEQVHRRSGVYWMRLAQNLTLDTYPELKALDHALTTKDAEQLIPLEYYHRHFMVDANSEGNQVDTLFPTRSWWSDNFNYLFSTELPAEFPNSLKSYQLSVYFKLLMSDPLLSTAARKECLSKVESFTDPRFEWVKDSSLLPLSRWTNEINRFHKKPFALELHHMFYPLITQSASGGLRLIKEQILCYLRDGKIGSIKINQDESPAYVASLMLRNLELKAGDKSTSAEEQPIIKTHLEPLYRRLDTLMDVEAQYQKNRKQNFEEALGRYIESFINAGLSSNTTKLQPRNEFRKSGQAIESVNAKKTSVSNILYSLAFDSNVLELVSFLHPASAGAILATKAIAKGVSSGSIKDIAEATMDAISTDKETKDAILESTGFFDDDVKWFNKNSKWLECFPFASELLKFYNQCTTWNKDKSYKLTSSLNGMAHLTDMLNSVSPGSCMAMSGVVTQALHNYYLPETKLLSTKSQQLFADAIAHALLGGLVVRQKLKKTSSIGKGNDKLYDVLHECIKVHGKHILALAPPLLKNDGKTITATQIVNSPDLTLAQKPIYPGIQQFGIFKADDAPTTNQKSATQQFISCC
ncbi:hypothetical protein [uncultured Legionella sp.]|uniref:hypothetical protein n=1 Tax=uncultured Legionella sp. TaxID=210934 RepID=UPI0026319157|nr:hypothetical protein [uncultured Legionella sp.]